MKLLGKKPPSDRELTLALAEKLERLGNDCYVSAGDLHDLAGKRSYDVMRSEAIARLEMRVADLKREVYA